MSGTILVLAGGGLGPLRRRDQPGLVRRRRDPWVGEPCGSSSPRPLYDGPHQSVAGPMGPAAGDGFQTVQSLLAIGSGGLLGLGLGKSRQKFPSMSPSRKTTLYSPSWGGAGIHRGGGGAAPVLPADHAGVLDGPPRTGQIQALTIVGIITLLAVQVFLNMGVVTNLIPNTGISLPFFQHGGTALMIQLAEMGIVLSISRQIPAPKMMIRREGRRRGSPVRARLRPLKRESG